MVQLKAELDDFIEGLKTLEILTLMRNYPNEMKPLFLPEKRELSSSTLKDIFSVEFSLQGSNQRQVEEVYMFWLSFLKDVEGMHI